MRWLACRTRPEGRFPEHLPRRRTGLELGERLALGYEFHIAPSREQAIREAAPHYEENMKMFGELRLVRALTSRSPRCAIRGWPAPPTPDDRGRGKGWRLPGPPAGGHHRGFEGGREALSRSRPRHLRNPARHPARRPARKPRPLREGGDPGLRHQDRRRGAVGPRLRRRATHLAAVSAAGGSYRQRRD